MRRWAEYIKMAMRTWVEFSSQWKSSYCHVASHLARQFKIEGLGATTLLGALVGSVEG